MSEHGRAHRCALHDLPHCSRPHQTVPYVREERPDARSGAWHPATPRPVRLSRWRTANPVARWLVLIGVVLMGTALIVLLAAAAGNAAADGFGPLIPATPSPTPYPNGWTP